MNKATSAQLTLLRKLSMKKYRLKERKFLVEGLRSVIQVLLSDRLGVEAVFWSDVATLSELQQETSSAPLQPRLFQVDAVDIAGIADTENTQGVIALCGMPEDPDPMDLTDREGLILATDQIQDPGNMGTLIRTASWFGLNALIAGTGSADPYHPKVVRSTAGALGTVPILSDRLADVLPKFEEQGWQVILLDAQPGSVPLGDLSAHNKRILVIGNEANGIRNDLFCEQRTPVHIPGNNEQVESLNASVAAAIALWQCVQLR